MNDLTEAWSLSGLVFIAGSVFLSGLQVHQLGVTVLKSLGQKQCWEYILLGSSAFAQSLHSLTSGRPRAWEAQVYPGHKGGGSTWSQPRSERLPERKALASVMSL